MFTEMEYVASFSGNFVVGSGMAAVELAHIKTL